MGDQTQDTIQALLDHKHRESHSYVTPLQCLMDNWRTSPLEHAPAPALSQRCTEVDEDI